jgi:hypothetical protein
MVTGEGCGRVGWEGADAMLCGIMKEPVRNALWARGVPRGQKSWQKQGPIAALRVLRYPKLKTILFARSKWRSLLASLVGLGGI